MLRELHISNLAVIADATIELHPGLNCFTGQTGAGKSLVIGALEILLGLRSAGDILRHGAAEGRVTGVFHLSNAVLRARLAAVTDLPLGEEPEVLLVRRIFASGRTSASLGGHPITSAMLRNIGETLADIHGQHDVQFLLVPANQLAMLDDFGGSAVLASQFAELFHLRQDLLSRLSELDASATLRRQRLELYEFQAAEIDTAQLLSGQQDQLEARHRMLSNIEKIKSRTESVYGALYEEEGAIIGRLKTLAAILLELVELDSDLGEPAAQVRDAAISLDDAAFSLRRRIDRLELKPDELAEITDRLNLINRLVHKYAGAGGTLADVLDYRQHIGIDLDELRQADSNLSGISSQIRDLETKLGELGRRLSAQRQLAVRKLIPLIHQELADLGMKESRFHVEIATASLPNPANQLPTVQAAKKPQQPGDMFVSAMGLESIEFMIAPNPGQPAAPLRKIVSGGELSRIMLALKSILAATDRVSVLVFDEIDANVGGRMGAMIGQKLRRLASNHQILCITHLPQIASYADRHITIRKLIEKGESFTNVKQLDGHERIQELAEMITGKDITAASLAQADELLKLAQRTSSQSDTAIDGNPSADKSPKKISLVQKKSSSRRRT